MFFPSPCPHGKNCVRDWRWLKYKRLKLKGVILWSWLFTLDLSHFWTQISLCLSLSPPFRFERVGLIHFHYSTACLLSSEFSCSTQSQIKWCCDMRVYFSPRFICWNPQCDGIWRRGLWGWLDHEGRALMNGTLMNGTPFSWKGSQRSQSTMWGQKKLAVCSPEERSHQNMAVLASWSWTSSR